ncbi:MAG TPA: glycosyltransferase [Baekduia sp.]|uniref:glycosyltransferase n=1 Tax=Baekduia sp. TaxID=2600305 RepID=UPI002CB73D5A|nr:glycosyltransferase [Baekduia sp.]HMJ36427.1 glycosyltransferase [Baekduia sp.]
MALTVVVLLRSPDDAARCLRALLPTLPEGVPVLAGGTAEAWAAAERLGSAAEAVRWLEADGAAAWNAAAALAPADDLVLLDGATEVADGWLDGLRAALGETGDVATATALSNDAAFLSVPRRNLPWPLLTTGQPVAEAARRVRAAAPDVVPRVPTALPHATLIARPALDLIGAFDPGLGDDREALADFCQRAGAAGLHHAVAVGVFVAHRRAEPDAPSIGPGAWPGAAGERHPALPAAVRATAEDRHSALARALLSAAVALEPLSVTIDARALAGGVTGTTMHIVELLGALAARDDVRVRAVLPARMGDAAAAALDGLHAVERLSEDQARGGVARTHVVHRPWQVAAVGDMAFLDALGERTLLTNQDLIAFRTPAVFADAEAWLEYRRITGDALALAAMVLFFSERAAADAADEDLVEPGRARVVALGSDASHVASAGAAPRRPRVLDGMQRPFLLMLGNRFRHKNGAFALRLLAALRADQGWDGELVFAGADVLHGSATAEEAAWLLRHPEHAAAVREAGVVDEAEKAWLLEHAAAVVYPSTYEGFGLIPFEAAAAGTPCLFAPVSSLRDTLPAAAALLAPWDARASAAAAIDVLRGGPAAEEHVAALRAAAAPLTWTATGDALIAAYRDAVRLPAPRAARLADDLARAEHDFWKVRDLVRGPGWALVQPELGLLRDGLQDELAGLLAQPGGETVLRRALRLARRLPRRA